MKHPLTLKDLKGAIICFIVGGCLATGLFCLVMGIFYNAELNEVLNVIDK